MERVRSRASKRAPKHSLALLPPSMDELKPQPLPRSTSSGTKNVAASEPAARARPAICSATIDSASYPIRVLPHPAGPDATRRRGFFVEEKVDVFLLVTSRTHFLASFFLDPTRVGRTDRCFQLAYCTSIDGIGASSSLASNAEVRSGMSCCVGNRAPFERCRSPRHVTSRRSLALSADT